MAVTSGTINSVVYNRDQIIADALSDLRVLSANGNPSADDLVKCTMKLNIAIKKWNTKGLMLWCRDTLQIPCVANKLSYTIGPVGADFTSYRPLRAYLGMTLISAWCRAGRNYATPA